MEESRRVRANPVTAVGHSFEVRDLLIEVKKDADVVVRSRLRRKELRQT